MKKLFAFLLVMLMPLSAMADPYSFSLSIDTDDVLFPITLKQMLMSETEALTDEQVESYAALLQYLTDGFALRVTFQEDAASLVAEVSGKQLLDIVAHTANGAMYLTSSLAPGYALVQKSGFSVEGKQDLLSAYEVIDWTNVGESVAHTFRTWLSEQEPAVAYGAFVGDAYEGGAVCTTWAFTDSDIAALVSALTTNEVQGGYKLCSSMGIDAEQLLTYLDKRNAEVADADIYMYIVRMVEDQRGNLRGLSFTIIEDVAQVATLSLGFTSNTLSIVGGLGLAEENYWWRFTARQSQRNNVTFLEGVSQEWLADKQQTFATVAATCAPLTDLAWQCNIAKSGKRYLWDASLFEENDLSNIRNVYLSSQGTVMPYENTLDGTLTIGYTPEIPLEIGFSYCPAEAIEPLDASLVMCDISNEADAALLQDITERITAACIARLIKILPADIVLTMMNQ